MTRMEVRQRQQDTGHSSILDTAQRVHSAITGSSDWYQDIERDVQIIHDVIATWEPIRCEFEGCVLNLLQAVIIEWTKR